MHISTVPIRSPIQLKTSSAGSVVQLPSKVFGSSTTEQPILGTQSSWNCILSLVMGH